MTPHYLEWEAAGLAPREVFAAAGANGFLGMAVPEEYGGGGVDDFRFNVVIAEELARAGIGGAGLGLTLHNDITTPVLPHLLQRGADRRAGCRASPRASSSPRSP